MKVPTLPLPPGPGPPPASDPPRPPPAAATVKLTSYPVGGMFTYADLFQNFYFQ